MVIPPTRLDDDVLHDLVAQMRNPEERLGDFRAQLAAQRLARARVDELCARHGRERIAAAMDELHAYSERVVRAGDRAAPRRPLRGSTTSSSRSRASSRSTQP